MTKIDEEELLWVLGLKPGATKDEIASAYRQLSRQYHPDKNTTQSVDDAEFTSNQYQKIRNAYETLTKRADEPQEEATSSPHTKTKSPNTPANSPSVSLLSVSSGYIPDVKPIQSYSAAWKTTPNNKSTKN